MVDDFKITWMPIKQGAYFSKFFKLNQQKPLGKLNDTFYKSLESGVAGKVI